MPTTSKTFAELRTMTAAGGTPQRPTTTGVMTTGSAATSFTTKCIGAGILTSFTWEITATINGGRRIASTAFTETLAMARKKLNAAGSTGIASKGTNIGSPATALSNGLVVNIAGECDHLHGDGMTTTSMAMA